MRAIALPILAGFLLASPCLAPPAAAGSPHVAGTPVAQLAITMVPDSAGVIQVPGPFAVLPGGTRVAVVIEEAQGILLLEGDRIVHHFPLAATAWARPISDMAASESLLVAGRRSRGEPITVDLFAFDLMSGQFVQRIQSGNPYLEAPEQGRDLWRIVVEGGRVGVFHPPTASTYPLWDRAKGVVAGSEQMVQATMGLGFGASALWIPNPDGSVDRKLPGRAEPLVSPGEGEFVGGVGKEVVVLLVTDTAPQRFLTPELVVHVLQGERAISELRLEAESPGIGDERLELAGRPVQVRNGRLYWVHVGPGFLEIRATDLPFTASP